MGWFDKFKSLFSIEVNAPLINITKNSSNQSKIDKEYVYDKDNNKIDVFLDNLPEEKQKKLKSILKENIDEGNKFLEEKTSFLLNDLYAFQKDKGDDEKLLDFFEPIISEEDLEALENSLYLRKKFRERKDVKFLKEDIITRFGDRGKNISNLCTAGYFENFLMPLYNSSQEDFKKIYEVAVSKSVLAIFVHSEMQDDEITKEIKRKLEISKKYGLKFLHIHGIGETNIETIKRCIEENRDFFNFYNKDIFEKNGIIVVEILL